jgi:HEAT repeat protein
MTDGLDPLRLWTPRARHNEGEVAVTGPTTPPTTAAADRLRAALNVDDSSVRLQAAMAAGTRPDPGYVGVLVARCAIEPDFYVRDMLTSALIRHPATLTVPLLLGDLRTGAAQARSQALHTLSKLGDPRLWPAITRELLQDPDDEVARSAWRAAVALVPAESETSLAKVLVTQLGRGSRDVRLSLSRALVALGDSADAALADATANADPVARRHAIATQRLALDPDAGLDVSIFEAKRTIALKDAPIADTPEESTTDPLADR